MKEDENNVILGVRVQPRSSKNEVCGVFKDEIKIKLTSPPINGEANEGLREFLSDILDISKGQIEIISGHRSKSKLIKIKNFKKEGIYNLLRGY
ncbi:MAG: YggU family protein [Nitrospinae bacterium]|nr:YggU family protein [Nitrospinota bacterium]